MRKTYKFSHSVSQGGFVYIQKAKIQNENALRNMLGAVLKKYGLIDPQIKIYKNIFFLFFMPRNVATQTIIDSVRNNAKSFADLDEKYILTTLYELSEECISGFLERYGFE